MPRTDPHSRASWCSFTFSDGRRCRLPRASNSGGYCATHARRIKQAEEPDSSIASILEPLCHPKIASTNLTFVLVRLLVEVSSGRISPRLSNALLRIIESLRKTVPDTSGEFARTFELDDLRNTIRSLYREHEDYIDPRMDSSIAPAAVKNPSAGSAVPPHQAARPASVPVPSSSPNPSPDSPALFDFLLQGRPLSARVTPRDVDKFNQILERKFAPHGSPPATASLK